ncbi:hypothetical protein VTO42DRAFT_3735 [Malbranchea cinnamomea]
MSNYQHQSPDMYARDPSSRSPGSHRHPPQQLHRQPSRQFDAYGSLPSTLYEDFTSRYEAARPEKPNQAMPANASYAYDISGSQTWTANGLGGTNVHNLGSIGAMSGSASTRMKPIRARSGLPATWLDQQPAISNASMSTAYQLPPAPAPAPQLSQPQPQPVQQDGEDELIPTAIVIKNIPFAVKKEQLVQLMTDMALPLPYAFNYHFDNGIFRGLAFANFTTPEETAVVIEALNHFELQGRKLRVEYKKMLPLHERERIEREKRERRGQLEEQHRPMAASQLQTQNSMSSLTSHLPTTSPSPVSQRNQKLEVDMNDAQTLSFYSQLLLFKQDLSREVLIFPKTLTPLQRRTVHTLAHNMGLCHMSRGQGEDRQVHVFRQQPTTVSPPAQTTPVTISAADSARRGLNRAATIDFSEARGEAPNPFGTLRSHNSGYLNVLDSSNGFGNPQNLRAAKSFADLRSYTPSPVPSSASFPAALQTNGAARVQQYEGSTSGSSNTPTLTTTPGSSTLGMQRTHESLLVDSFGSLSLGTSVGGGSGLGGTSGSPHRLRGMFSWEQQDPQSPATAPIGSNRSFGMGFEQPQDRLPVRQPRGPAPERGAGFRRNGHQSRGSDEARTNSGVDIIVE